MNIETIIIIITLFFAANTYYDGSLLKDFSKYKKYYKIAGCLFVGLSFYAMIKKNPDQSRNLIQSTSEFIKILPVDQIFGQRQKSKKSTPGACDLAECAAPGRITGGAPETLIRHAVPRWGGGSLRAFRRTNPEGL